MMTKTAALADIKESIKQFLNKWYPVLRGDQDEFMDDVYELVESIMKGSVRYVYQGIMPGKGRGRRNG